MKGVRNSGSGTGDMAAESSSITAGHREVVDELKEWVGEKLLSNMEDKMLEEKESFEIHLGNLGRKVSRGEYMFLRERFTENFEIRGRVVLKKEEGLGNATEEKPPGNGISTRLKMCSLAPHILSFFKWLGMAMRRRSVMPMDPNLIHSS